MAVFAAFEKDGTQVSDIESDINRITFSSLTARVLECPMKTIIHPFTEEELWNGASHGMEILNPITEEVIEAFPPTQ